MLYFSLEVEYPDGKTEHLDSFDGYPKQQMEDICSKYPECSEDDDYPMILRVYCSKGEYLYGMGEHDVFVNIGGKPIPKGNWVFHEADLIEM